MIPRLLRVAAALALLNAGIGFAEGPVVHVEPLVQEALERNPKIIAARERHTALME